MADISRFPLFRHLRADASSHVLLFQGAKVKRSGRGLSFWFRPFAVSLAEIPVDDREVALTIHGRSADFQDIVVQGSLTYRVTEPALTATRVDFAIDLWRGTHLRQPLEKLASILTQLSQEAVLSYVQAAPLRELVLHGHEGVRTAIEAGFASALTLEDLGLSLVAVRVASIKPSTDVEHALEAPTRERIQEEADEATFRRRARAVDKERAIAENELQNQIELARREQQLIEQRGQNARKEAGEKAEAARIDAEAKAERTRIHSDAEAGGVRAVEGAHLSLERERMEAYKGLPAAVLVTLVARELAGKLPPIGNLNVTPDLLGPLLAGLLGAGTRKLEADGKRP